MWGMLCRGSKRGQREARTKVWTVATARGGEVGFLRALQALQDPPQSTPVSLPFFTPSEQVAAAQTCASGGQHGNESWLRRGANL